MKKGTRDPKTNKNLKIAKRAKSSDNKTGVSNKIEPPVHENIEIVFHSSSKLALESCTQRLALITALQHLVLKYQKEIGALGQAFNMNLNSRVVFSAQIK